MSLALKKTLNLPLGQSLQKLSGFDADFALARWN